MFVPVIMAGGAGTRLWPLSRKLYPKQYLSFENDLTMLQQTLLRLEGLASQKPILLCNEEQRFMAAEQMRRMGIEDCPILLEPEGRNTAPAIALAALHAEKDSILLILPADHIVADIPAFHNAVEQALKLAEQDKLVTFGIVPHSPETGYGYIQQGSGNEVLRFVEKPDAETAKQYLQSGDFFWNSGMFMFRAGKYLEELKRFQPEMLDICVQAMKKASKDMDFIRVDASIFLTCPENSIDYAVMENTDNAVIVPLDAGWCDVGSWSALWNVSPRDDQGNACRGDVMALDTRNSFILAEERLVTTLGVDDLVVVETKDAVLVSTKEKAQEIKSLVNEIKKNGRSEHITHREVFRPWGSYDSIAIGDRYQVKRITVKPGAKLSVQMHHHRAEHWVVVSGTARVTNGKESFLVTENQSTYIPVGQIHALENPGSIPLELIEVQSGPYLGEDDIVRIEDVYGRV